jgi:hypothetical protein
MVETGSFSGATGLRTRFLKFPIRLDNAVLSIIPIKPAAA